MIKGTCRTCAREFAADQAIQGGGECPWCGTPFSPDYAVALVGALADMTAASAKLERAIEAIADLHPSFTLETDTVLGKMTRDLERLRGAPIRQG
jgi:hypothetical protein